MSSSSEVPLASHGDAIRRWPSIAIFAEDLGIPYETAKKMCQRDSIGREHWTDVVSSARERGIRGITLEFLARTVLRRTAVTAIRRDKIVRSPRRAAS